MEALFAQAGGGRPLPDLESADHESSDHEVGDHETADHECWVESLGLEMLSSTPGKLL